MIGAVRQGNTLIEETSPRKNSYLSSLNLHFETGNRSAQYDVKL